MKKTLIKLFYTTIILILSCQAMYTVYKLGGTVGQGEKLERLTQQQVGLEKELQQLQEARSSTASLTSVAAVAKTGYQAIQQPIILTVDGSVASR